MASWTRDFLDPALVGGFVEDVRHAVADLRPKAFSATDQESLR